MDWLKKVWSWLDGKKTPLGATLLLAEKVTLLLPIILPAYGLDVAHAAGIVGTVTAVIGLLHKAWKWKFGTEHA